nr:ABC transporter substrate binding protein [Motiliproteus sediminis]
MDTKRLPPSRHQERAEAAWQYALTVDADLFILGDDNALRFLGPRLADTGKPLVYLGINQNPRRYLGEPRSNVSGVLERPLLKRSIAYLNLVMGRPLDKVLVLFDGGTTSKTVLEESFSGRSLQRIGSTLVDIRLIARQSQWQRTIRNAQAEGFDLIVVGLYHTLVDDEGNHVNEQRVIEWSALHSPLPLFGFWSFSVGAGMTAGGLVLDGYEQGRAAGQMAVNILKGEPPPRLPVTPGSGKLIFSRSQLQRWGIGLPSRLQEEAEFVP